MVSFLPEALNWALEQDMIDLDENGNKNAVGKYNKESLGLVDKVREYFDDNKIDYPAMSFADLKPYL